LTEKINSERKSEMEKETIVKWRKAKERQRSKAEGDRRKIGRKKKEKKNLECQVDPETLVHGC
jgi:hypothetical protein